MFFELGVLKCRPASHGWEILGHLLLLSLAMSATSEALISFWYAFDLAQPSSYRFYLGVISDVGFIIGCF